MFEVSEVCCHVWEKVSVNKQVDTMGNCSLSVNSIPGITLNPSGGMESKPFKDGDPCSPWAIIINKAFDLYQAYTVIIHRQLGMHLLCWNNSGNNRL